MNSTEIYYFDELIDSTGLYIFSLFFTESVEYKTEDLDR